MYRRQKINLASRISGRGLAVLLPHFTNEQFIAFCEAERKGEEAEYIRTQRRDLSDMLQKNILSYLELLEKLSSIEIDRQTEILLAGVSDREGWNFAQDKGVIEEYLFLKEEFEDRQVANAGKILQLFEQEIKMLAEHADAVLSLDPELALLARFDELPPSAPGSQGLEALLDEGVSMILGQAVLRCLAPQKDGTLLSIDPALKLRIGRFLEKDIFSFLPLDDTLSPASLQRMRQDFRAFVEYAVRQEDEPQFPAYLALRFENLPTDFRQSPEYLAILWQLGEQYRNISLKSGLDYVALIRLYEFITGLWGRVREEPERISGAGDVVMLEIIANRELGEFYAYFWEWEEAVAHYKVTARVAQDNGMGKEMEGAFFMAINCLKQCFQYKEAVDYVIATLQGKRGKWGLPRPFELSPALRNTLGSELAFLLQALPLDEKQIDEMLDQVESPALRQMITMNRALDKDEISVEQMEEMQRLLASFHGHQMVDYFGKELSPQEMAEQVLEPLGFFDSTTESYELQLSQISPVYEALPPDLQLLYNLHQAKLGFLKGDRACLEIYPNFLLQIERHPRRFGVAKNGHWHNEYLRALSLSINEGSHVYPLIENSTRSAIQLLLANYLRDFQERSSWRILQGEWENTYKALLYNIKACTSPDTMQDLLRLLWNILVYTKQAFHLYQGMGAASISDTKAWEDIQGKLSEQLWQYYAFGIEEAGRKARQMLSQMQQLVLPHLRSEQFLGELRDPWENSVLFHFFTRINGERSVLVLSFRKEGHETSKAKYAYQSLDNFSVLEQFLDEQQTNFALQWKQEGLLSLLQKPQALQQLNGHLANFLDAPETLGGATAQQGRPLHLYADQFLHEFPLEMLSKEGEMPLGFLAPMASVIHRAGQSTETGLERGLASFSGVPTLPGFPELKYSTVETAAIASEFSAIDAPVYEFGGMDANKGHFLKVLEQRPAVLHLAVHGATDKGLHPTLVLAPMVNGKPHSALLTYYEVMNLDLSFVDLVVLSACNSSAGRIQKGSPMQGMAYAFLRAGAHCIVASRLPISDEATAVIMQQFYHCLMVERDALSALQNTRRHFLHPNEQIRLMDIASWGVWI